MAHSPARDLRSVRRNAGPLVGLEAEHARILRDVSSDPAWPNRVCCRLSDDFFLQHTRLHLASHRIAYHRIAIESRNEVWYFFKRDTDIAALLEAHSSVPESLKQAVELEE